MYATKKAGCNQSLPTARGYKYLKALSLAPVFDRLPQVRGYQATPILKGVHSADHKMVFERAPQELLSQIYLESLQRLVSTASFFVKVFPASLKHRHYALKMDYRVLGDNEFCRHLHNTATALNDRGCTFIAMIQLPDQPLSAANLGALVRQANQLKDMGVQLHASCSLTGDTTATEVLSERKLLDVVHVAIEELGIGPANDNMDHSRLLAGLTRIGTWLHSTGTRLGLLGINTAWQADAAQGIPAFVFQGSYFCEPEHF